MENKYYNFLFDVIGSKLIIKLIIEIKDEHQKIRLTIIIVYAVSLLFVIALLLFLFINKKSKSKRQLINN